MFSKHYEFKVVLAGTEGVLLHSRCSLRDEGEGYNLKLLGVGAMFSRGGRDAKPAEPRQTRIPRVPRQLRHMVADTLHRE